MINAPTTVSLSQPTSSDRSHCSDSSSSSRGSSILPSNDVHARQKYAKRLEFLSQRPHARPLRLQMLPQQYAQQHQQYERPKQSLTQRVGVQRDPEDLSPRLRIPKFPLRADIATPPASPLSPSLSEASVLAQFSVVVIANLWASQPANIVLPQGVHSGELLQFQSFCQRIYQATHMCPVAAMYGLELMTRFRDRYPHIVTISGSQYRIFMMSLMMANKFLDDVTFTNRSWAKAWRRTVREVNQMEMEFLHCLSFHLDVLPSKIDAWRKLYHAFELQHLTPTLFQQLWTPGGAAMLRSPPTIPVYLPSPQSPNSRSQIPNPMAASELGKRRRSQHTFQSDPDITSTMSTAETSKLKWMGMASAEDLPAMQLPASVRPAESSQ